MRRFNILVGAIPVYEDHVLLTQRSLQEKFLPGAWGLPSGKINFGETLEDAVLRELYEETGLRGEIMVMTGYSMFMSTQNDDELHNLQINFIIKLASRGPVVLDKASASYDWIPIKDYGKLQLDPFTTNTLMQAIQHLSTGA